MRKQWNIKFKVINLIKYEGNKYFQWSYAVITIDLQILQQWKTDE